MGVTDLSYHQYDDDDDDDGIVDVHDHYDYDLFRNPTTMTSEAIPMVVVDAWVVVPKTFSRSHHNDRLDSADDGAD
jgi:hypothetical protein